MKDIRERLDKLGQTRMPLWIVGVLAGVLVGLVVPVDKMTIGTVVASPFVALAFWLQPYSIFAPLVIAAMLTHYRFATVIGHWRLEQAISTLGVVGLWKVYRHKLDGTWYRGTVLGGLAAWIAVNAVASLGAPQVFQSEKIVVWLVTDVFVLLLTRQYVTQFGLGRAVRVFYIWGELALLYGLVLFGFHLSQGNLVRAWGSMQESDLYGTFAAIMVLLGLGMLQEVSWENRMRRMVIWASVGISVMALVASGTRSSLLALGGVAIIMAVVERSWRPVLLKTLPLFIAVLALAHIGSQAAVAETLRGAPQRAILAASGSPRNSPDTLIAERDQSRVIVASFVSRLSNITHSYTLAYRLVRVREALQGIVSSTRFFLLGHGTNAFGQYHSVVINGKRGPDYLPVEIVTVPYDTGLIGVVAFGYFVWRVLQKTFLVFWKKRPVAPLAIASSYALLVMFVAYQATNGIWLGFTWIILGFALTASQKNRVVV